MVYYSTKVLKNLILYCIYTCIISIIKNKEVDLLVHVCKLHSFRTDSIAIFRQFKSEFLIRKFSCIQYTRSFRESHLEIYVSMLLLCILLHCWL